MIVIHNSLVMEHADDIDELSKRKPDYWTLIISKQMSQNGTKVE